MSQRLFVPNSIALRNFDTILKQNSFCPWEEEVHVDFHPKYIAMHPVGLALLAAFGDMWRENGVRITGSLDRKISSIPYLQRMGLFRSMGFVEPKEINAHEETGRFIPLTKIRNSEELENFVRTIDPLLHTTRENSRVIKHVFSELLRNVLEHSRARFGANVCATYNRRRNKISIGISDAGQGLYSSLRKSHKVKDDLDAICLALTPGITGSTSRLGGNEQNAGAGLFFTKCIAQSTHNHFLIYSGSAYFKLRVNQSNDAFNTDPRDDRSTMRDGLPSFHGTLVGMDINIGNQEAFKDLIDRIGEAYQLGVKKVKKDYSSKIRFT